MKTKKIITLKDLRQKIGEVVNRAQLLDEETIITKMGKPVAKIVPIAEDDIK